MERLNKYLSRVYEISRRKADSWIDKGYVSIDSVVVSTQGVQVDNTMEVTVSQEALNERSNFSYFLLNKPIGVVCTRSEQEGKNIFELLPPIEGLAYAGRLDKESRGLIIVSNDGKFVYQVAGSEFDKSKTYIVKLDIPVTDDDLTKMARGIVIEGKETKPAEINRMSLNRFQITLREGMNRQIRRMCLQLGYHVRDLKRIDIHGIRDEALSEGYYRELTLDEIKKITNG